MVFPSSSNIEIKEPISESKDQWNIKPRLVYCSICKYEILTELAGPICSICQCKLITKVE